MHKTHFIGRSGAPVERIERLRHKRGWKPTLLQVSRDVIQYVSGACGSGKTAATCAGIATRAYGNIVYVAPTIELLGEVEDRLRGLRQQPFVITHKSHPKQVASELIWRLKNPFYDESLILITWSAYETLQYFPNKEAWTVIIDEIPQVDRYYPLVLPKHHVMLSEHIDLTASPHKGLGIVRLKDAREAKRFLGGVRDDIDDVVRDVVRDVFTGNRIVYADRESWNRICLDNEIGKSDDSNTIHLLSMLTGKLFENSILLGANIEDSILKKYLETCHKARFAPNHAIGNSLSTIEPFRDRVEIAYFLDHTRMSKRFGKGIDAKGVSRLDEMDELARQHLGDRNYLYVCNNDRNSKIIDSDPKHVWIPVGCQGINKYSHIDAIYLSPSLNRKPQHFKMLEAIGLTVEEVQKATAFETYYQAVNRTSIRDPSSKRPVTIVVPDKFIAEHLAAQLGSNNLVKLGSIPEPQRGQKLTGAEKRRRMEANARWRELFGSGQHDPNVAAASILVTLHQGRYDVEPDQFKAVPFTVQEFVDFLRREAANPVLVKDKRRMFNPGHYAPSAGAASYRKMEYLAQTSFMVLDFDNGSLGPKQFIDLFGLDAPIDQRVSFVIYNSFSRSAEETNRFQVVLPYATPARSAEEHRAVYRWMREVLEHFGFASNVSGLDPNSGAANQSFYLPCTNRNQPEHQFFEWFWTRDREIEKFAVNPAACAALYAEDNSTPNRSLTVRTITPAEIDACFRDLVIAGDDRNNIGLVAVCRLMKMGMTDYQIVAEYKRRFQSDPRMMKRLNGYLKSGRRYQLRW